MMQGKGWHSYF